MCVKCLLGESCGTPRVGDTGSCEPQRGHNVGTGMKLRFSVRALLGLNYRAISPTLGFILLLLFKIRRHAYILLSHLAGLLQFKYDTMHHLSTLQSSLQHAVVGCSVPWRRGALCSTQSWDALYHDIGRAISSSSALSHVFRRSVQQDVQWWFELLVMLGIVNNVQKKPQCHHFCAFPSVPLQQSFFFFKKGNCWIKECMSINFYKVSKFVECIMLFSFSLISTWGLLKCSSKECSSKLAWEMRTVFLHTLICVSLTDLLVFTSFRELSLHAGVSARRHNQVDSFYLKAYRIS